MIQRRYRNFKSLPEPISVRSEVHVSVKRKVSPVAKANPVVLPQREYSLDESEILEPGWMQFVPCKPQRRFFPQDNDLWKEDENSEVFLKQHNVSSQEHSPLSTCLIEKNINHKLEFTSGPDVPCDFSMTLYKQKIAEEAPKELDTQVIKAFALKEKKGGLPFVIRDVSDAKSFSKDALIERIVELSQGLKSK